MPETDDILICPDCGGQIGGTGKHKPCTCELAQKPVEELEDAPSTDTKDSGGKRCRVCNKDLTGQRRYRDEGGYICPQCSKKATDEKREREAGLVKCPDCRRKIKPAGLVPYHGRMVCKQCQMGYLDSNRLKVAKVKLTHHRESEKKSLYVMLVVFGVLLLIAIATWVF